MEQKDDRDILEVLKFELEFLEKGGYGRSPHDPQKSASFFQDSPTCFAFPARAHEDCCVLMQFVPPEARNQEVPCHHIPLGEAGETIAALKTEERTEETLKDWLRQTIARIEEERSRDPR